MRLIDLTGKQFGRLNVLNRYGSRGDAPTWLCLCACGIRTVVLGEALRDGHTTSCGCFASECRSAEAKDRVTHGHTVGLRSSLTFAAWQSMRARCLNPNNGSYHRYGARGITVSSRWDNFTVFVADMGERPAREYSIDRIDNTKGYAPENCRWATKREQALNREGVRFLVFRGETADMSEWARRAGFGPTTLRERLEAGWSVEDALTIRKYGRRNREMDRVNVVLPKDPRPEGAKREYIDWKSKYDEAQLMIEKLQNENAALRKRYQT
jgi:hypothetical protein